MGLYYQAFTGGAAGRGVAAEDILRRLRNVPVQAVIVGWSEDPALYRELGEALHRRGAELWLWFPVFSEHTLREGLRRQTGLLTGAPVFDGDETFDFCCPSQAGLAQRLLEKYDRDFAGCAFDGMFLDRIRYPSLTVGAEALFGCACGECRDWLAENGLPRQVQDDLAQRIAARMSDEDCIDPLGLLQYCAGQYIFADPALETLLRLKCQRIESVVRVLCGGFRSRGMKVAMDLFAPFLAPLVGQDYRRLGAMADFIKPMLYRHTYHMRMLPSGGAAASGAKSARETWEQLVAVIKDFFLKKHIWYYIAFIILYRLAEGFVMKIVPLFLKAERSAGGLGLNEQQIGLYYGTYGAAAFVLGSLLAGYYISHRGLRRTLFSLCCIFNLPFVAYTLLAMYQPESGLLIGSAIVLEYFGYGFGFVGLTLFMMQQVAPGKHQMAHYAFASGIMNLGVMLPGTISGFVSDWLGYEAFFTFTLFATIPAFLITYFIPFTYADEKKQQ